MGYKIITADEIRDPEDLATIDMLRLALKRCAQKLREGGADRYVLNASRSVINEFNVDGGEFSLFRTLFSDGLSVTAYVGSKRGVISGNKLDDESIDGVAESVLAAANAAEPDDAWKVAPKEENRIFLKGAPYCDTDGLFAKFREFIETVQKDYPLILMEQSITSHNHVCNVYVNSSGTEFVTISGQYMLSAMFSGHDGDKTSSFVGEGFITDDLSSPFIGRSRLAKTLDETQRQIHTESFDGKFTGTLVAPPGLLQTLLESAIGNFASDGPILNGTSIWKDKLGEQVADPRLTISFIPSTELLPGGDPYTHEGYLASDYAFIEKGVLKYFDISDYIANKTGFERAPNSGSNLVIEPGDTPLSDIIASVDRGIYVGRFSGGEPSVNGDFSGVAKNSFLIENGKLTKPLRETMISGNLAELLLNIGQISKETVNDGFTVLPYVSFPGVTISGK